MVHLVRLILEDDWHPAVASVRLRAQVPDSRVLREMATRVQRAMFERPSPVADRALRTVVAAIGEAQPGPRTY